MKKLLIITAALCASAMLYSCEESDIDQEIEEEEEVGTCFLADLNATTYPSVNTWIILDEEATTEDFAGLKAALMMLSSESRRSISLEFPNLKAIPDYVPCVDDMNLFWVYGALVSVKADVATTVGDNAFYGCHALTTVEFPEATTFGDRAFQSCSALTSVELPKATTFGDACVPI